MNLKQDLLNRKNKHIKGGPDLAKKNYYGIRKGKETGVFDNLEITLKYVKGFKGAEFKGFSTKEEANEYISESLPANQTIPQKTSPKELNKSKSEKPITNKAKRKVSVEEYKKISTHKEQLLYISTLNDEEKNELVLLINQRIDAYQKMVTDLMKIFLVDKYRKFSNDKERLRYVSSLNDGDKNILYSLMTPQEIEKYRKMAADLMERRFKSVQRDKELLDYLTQPIERIRYQTLFEKYINVDLSITIYTIKAILNVMGESDFSKDDGSSYFNVNSGRYYSICKNYWGKIWWDTDTGVLSKEEIKAKKFSEYHKICNKISTISEIRKQLYQNHVEHFAGERYSVTDFVR